MFVASISVAATDNGVYSSSSESDSESNTQNLPLGPLPTSTTPSPEPTDRSSSSSSNSRSSCDHPGASVSRLLLRGLSPIHMGAFPAGEQGRRLTDTPANKRPLAGPATTSTTITSFPPPESFA